MAATKDAPYPVTPQLRALLVRFGYGSAQDIDPAPEARVRAVVADALLKNDDFLEAFSALDGADEEERVGGVAEGKDAEHDEVACEGPVGGARGDASVLRCNMFLLLCSISVVTQQFL